MSTENREREDLVDSDPEFADPLYGGRRNPAVTRELSNEERSEGFRILCHLEELRGRYPGF